MKKIFFLFIISYLCVTFNLYAKDIEIKSKVIIVNPALEFFIIDAGETSGIEIGDSAFVYKKGKKIAEAYIIEVRPEVAAAEIISIAKGASIKEGDDILITKEIKSERRETLKKKKSKWTTILGMKSTGTEATQNYSVESGVTEKVDTFGLEIKAEPRAVFSYARLILRENGFSIDSTNRTEGLMLATRPIELSLMKELWADATASIGHKLVVSISIKKNNGYTKLTLSSFKEHSQKGRYIKRALTGDSKYYKELVKLASEIKKRAED